MQRVHNYTDNLFEKVYLHFETYVFVSCLITLTAYLEKLIITLLKHMYLNLVIYCLKESDERKIAFLPMSQLV